jgi:NADH-quinone oxidoreductase subunit J
MSHIGLTALTALAAVDWSSWGTWHWIAVATLLALALWQTVPNGRSPGLLRRATVMVAGVSGLLLLWLALPGITASTVQAAFAGFATLTIFAAVATISARSPVYSAIWFALALLGTAGLFLLQGSQFLGVATVAVYAGAIVVTFLFVLMLAQPEGHAFYDRISWGSTPGFVGAVTAVFFAVIVAIAVTTPDADAMTARAADAAELQEDVSRSFPPATVRAQRYLSTPAGVELAVSLAVPPQDYPEFREAQESLEKELLASQQTLRPDWNIQRVRLVAEDVRAVNHAAGLGAQLFSRHLIAVQAAGALLMAALVGAVAIASRSGSLD